MLVALLLAAAAVTALVAARCDDGLTPFGGSCCITPGTVPGATCVLSSSGQVTTTCTWTRRADDVRYTYTVPSSIPYIYSVTLKGTHGEWLDVATPDAGYQRGSIFKSGYFAAAGQTFSICPGSYYGGLGGGLPAASSPLTQERGISWARGGAASALFGPSNSKLVAAGGGGMGRQFGAGTDADYSQNGYFYLPGSAGEQPYTNIGGGGAGYYGGQSRPQTGISCVSCGFGSSCCSPVYGAARGGISGSTGFNTYWSFIGYNSDLSATNPLVLIEFACAPAVPTTTVRLPTPAVTSTATEISTAVETSTVPSPTVTVVETVEGAPSYTYTDSTVTPDASYTTRIDTATTYPPESTDFATSTPDTSFFTESPTVTTTPATSTVYETVTPATRFFTETVPALVTPETVVETVTVTPSTQVVPATVTELRTVSSGTVTSVVSTTTGSAKCFQFRMVYPPACCPTAYIKGLKPWTSPDTIRRRNVIFARDLTTVFTPSGTTTLTVNTVTTSTALVTPDPVLVTETSTAPGPTRIVTKVTALEPETVTVDETQTVEGVASTTTLTITAPAPSVTVTETQFVEAATPLSTDLSTADAPLSTATETSYSTVPAPRSTVQEEAATPFSTSTSTDTEYSTVPTTTTTSTAYSRPTVCALKPPLSIKCPVPALRTADQVVQIALIKAQKFLSGGRPVQIDCGSAGVWSYA
ncbi:hypothetical protein DMC30DRAFT_413272 [Rhodotorula diobovata]|uniref:Proteophosphoglycan ppg4 n=1 Tax=Rhodotorula diobovata TaxID=5288 RepID=A0A5C5G5E5_9BASI|nr:hypothetical protein DMC30DRAFT_413272 [Rhodotorula diobovata]